MNNKIKAGLGVVLLILVLFLGGVLCIKVQWLGPAIITIGLVSGFLCLMYTVFLEILEDFNK